MSYEKKLVERISESLKGIDYIPKKMFGGVVFMIDDKMSVGVNKNDLIVRADPKNYDSLMKKKGAREFDFTGKPMKGWIIVNEEGFKSKADLQFWVDEAVEYNKIAKSSKKKK